MIYKNPEQPVAVTVAGLLSRMSIEEKLAQLHTVSYTQLSSVHSLPRQWRLFCWRMLSDCYMKTL